MKLPQIILIIWFALALGISMANHGKEKKASKTFWTSLISVGIEVGILYWGGFFN